MRRRVSAGGRNGDDPNIVADAGCTVDNGAAPPYVPTMDRNGVCDGCGQYGAVDRGVCAMCLLDGVPQRPSAAEERAELAAKTLPSAPDTFPTVARERERVASIRAEDPSGWAAVLGPAV